MSCGDPKCIVCRDERGAREALKFGARHYNAEQAARIRRAVRERQPLPAKPLPFDSREDQ